MRRTEELRCRRWPPPLLLLMTLIFFVGELQTDAVDFVFNGFSSSDLLIYGNATIEAGVLALTREYSLTIGRALHPSRVPTRFPNSSRMLPFSISFIFCMAPYRDTLPGHGIVLLFTPVTGLKGTSSSQHLGLFNFSNNGDPNNHVLGIEFDVFANQEFNDINDNHVGIDVNSLTSVSASGAGYWSVDGVFKELKLNSGENYQAWVDYSDSDMNVTMAPAGMKKPRIPLLEVQMNLSDVLLDEMYVGFTAATGRLVQSHRILAWSFSNSNFSLSESLVTTNLPSFVLSSTPFIRSKGFVAGIASAVLLLMILLCLVSWWVRRKRRRRKMREEGVEDWEIEYWPHRISYHDIEVATEGFSESNVVGAGSNGKVYRGILPAVAGGAEVAIKRISRDNSEGTREFLAEISSLGRLKHRNLAALRGWCRREKGSFMVVYDYMENGSLDKRIFECDEEKVLRCEERIRILRGVAAGVMYLHEGWERRVLHRDIKASNVLLDGDMNARLGDFGLARVHGHDSVASTTRVVGTVGYLAPELIRTGRASDKTDVYGYGVLVLELMCGRRPVDHGKPLLVDWAWGLAAKDELHLALDRRLNSGDAAADLVLRVGLLCTHPDPEVRPTMRQVVKLLDRHCSDDQTDQSDDEDMESYLLEAVKSNDLQSRSRGLQAHPTFAELQPSLSSSMSACLSDVAIEGR